MTIPTIPPESFPRFVRVRQEFPASPPIDVDATIEAGLAGVAIRPGERLALTAGSRGVAGMARVLAALVRALRQRGAAPFIVPAMGSHGGATPDGQRAVLAGYGITEESMGAPILSDLEVDPIGQTADGVTVYCSRTALQADGIVVVNRIKPHTDFGGPLGSGLLKMMAIGLGKQHGANTSHRAAARLGLAHVVGTVGRLVLQRAPIRCGVGLVEGPLHDLAEVEVIPREAIETREPQLLENARARMARLPWEELDLLIVDEMGKDVSGTGMDPNVVGRHVHGYDSSLAHIPSYRPIIRRILVRGLTPDTHGNAVGLGLADFATRRLTDAIDWHITLTNALSSVAVMAVKTPITLSDDRTAVGVALASLALPDPTRARVARIHDTLSLQELLVSEACLESPPLRPLRPLGPPAPLAFAHAGALAPM